MILPYHFVRAACAFDMTLARSAKRPVALLMHNGVEIGEHANRAAAEIARDMVSFTCGTHPSCMDIVEVVR